VITHSKCTGTNFPEFLQDEKATYRDRDRDTDRETDTEKKKTDRDTETRGANQDTTNCPEKKKH
jgi:hypothetical protein